MKGLIVFLVVLVVALQYKLWFAKGGIVELWQLKEQIGRQIQQNDVLALHNEGLSAEVHDLKHGTEAVEEHARNDLGLVRQDEEFYQIVSEGED